MIDRDKQTITLNYLREYIEDDEIKILEEDYVITNKQQYKEFSSRPKHYIDKTGEK